MKGRRAGGFGIDAGVVGQNRASPMYPPAGPPLSACRVFQKHRNGFSSEGATDYLPRKLQQGYVWFKWARGLLTRRDANLKMTPSKNNNRGDPVMIAAG